MTAPNYVNPPAVSWWVKRDRIIFPTAAELALTMARPSLELALHPAAASLALTGAVPTLTILAPVAYDATGVGWPPTTGSSSFSYNHTAAAGADVFCDVAVDRGTVTINTPTWDGAAMSLVGTATFAGAGAGGADLVIKRFRKAGVAGGTKAVAGSLSSGAVWGCSGSVSYTNVVSVGTAQTAHGSSGPSQAVTCGAGDKIIQSIQIMLAAMGTLSGGTNRYTGSNANMSLEISDASASTTFTTSNTGKNWNALANVLSNH